MAVEPQPTYIPEWNTGGSNRTNPSGAEKVAGWALNDQPPSSYFNWLQYYTGAWFTWLNQRIYKGSGEIDLVVKALAPDTSGGGGDLTLGAGDGFTAGAGGNVAINAGDGAGAAAGGNVSIAAGAPDTSGGGGDASLTAGDGIGAEGGDLTLAAGDSDSDGGDVAVDAGANTSAGPGGNMTMAAGNAVGGNAGDASFKAGTANSPGPGQGGDLTLAAGDGYKEKGGDVSLTAGDADGTSATANGGAVSISAGSGGVLGLGGAVNIASGGSGTDYSGDINIDCADGKNGGGSARLTGGNGWGPGGSVTLEGGDSTVNNNGGNVQLTAGDSTGTSGDGGNVNAVAGGSANGQPGNVNLTGGPGTGAKGGDANITGGTTTSGAGGNAAIAGGAGVGGEGGDVTVDGGASDTDGGDVTISGGANSSSGPAGYVTLQGGAPTNGAGGSCNLRGGDVGTDGRGGSASLRGGNSKGTDQLPGNVVISSGDSTGNIGGSVKLRVAEAGASSGSGVNGEVDYLECDGQNKLVDIVHHTQFAAAAGDTARGPIRVVGKSAEPTGPSAGDMYYDTRTNQVAVYNGTRYVNLNPLVLSMSDGGYLGEAPSFLSGADMVLNQTPYGGSVGTTPVRHIIPANTLRPGTIIRVRAQFVIVDIGGGSTYPSPRIWVGSIGAPPSPYTSPTGVKIFDDDKSSQVWDSCGVEADLCVRSGSPNNVDVHWRGLYKVSAGTFGPSVGAVPNTYTLDTSVAIDVFPAVKWGTASDWQFFCYQFIVDVI